MALIAVVWTYIRIRRNLGAQLKQIQHLPDSGGGFVTNTDWSPVYFSDPVALLGIIGLVLFLGASVFSAMKVIRRRQ